jgi:superfamily II DNA or RNA helicase
MTRDQRQDLSVTRYIKTGGCGTLEAVTAYGKTRVALRLIKHMRRKHPARKVTVIVPRENLQTQWQEALKREVLEANTEVVIINTAIKRVLIETDFLILDEIHRYAADSFSRIFGNSRYRFLLGLTGTIKRSDKKHKMLQEKCPIFDRITLDEARRNGWVSNFIEINLGLELSLDDEVWYREKEEKYNKSMDLFQWDFELMANCAKDLKPKIRGAVYEDPPAVRYARKCGWKGNTAYAAQKLLSEGRKRGIWGGSKTDPYNPEVLRVVAINAMRLNQKIKNFIYNHTSKIDATLSIIDKFPRKTITFAQSTTIADEVTKRLNAILPFPLAKSYHSALPSIIVDGKKLSKKATREYVLESFRLNDCVHLNTAMAVDEGADFPDVQMGIRIAGTSSQTQQTQRRGRIIRLFEDKFALFWNIYLKGTKETQWLQKAQNYSEDVLWVDSLEEVVKFLSDADERETDSGVL